VGKTQNEVNRLPDQTLPCDTDQAIYHNRTFTVPLNQLRQATDHAHIIQSVDVKCTC